MTASELRPILTQVAQRTLPVADAQQQLSVQDSPSVLRLKSTITWVILLGFLLVGLYLIRHAFVVTASQQTIDDRSRLTTGTVVRMVPKIRKHTGHRLLVPVVTYQVNGNRYSFESELASSPPAYQIGEKVKVQYDPNKPGTAAIKSVWISWLPLLLFGGFGSLVTLISVVGLVALVRSKAQQANPAPEIIHQRLKQVAAGTITVDDAIQQLLPNQAVKTSDASSSLGWRLFLGAFLLAVIYFSLQQAGKSWRLLVNGKTVQGKVVGLVRSTKGNTRAPLFRYSIDGNEYERVGTTYSSPPAYEVGEVVTVVYEPTVPAEGTIQSFSDQWAGPLFGLALAGIFLFALGRPKAQPNH